MVAGKRLILYIEDVLSNTVMVSRICDNMGIDLEIAKTGMDGLDNLTKRVPDLLLLDIGLPDIDGLEVVSRIRSDVNPDIAALKVVALTAHAMNGDRERCLAAGCDAYLAKPYGVDVLVKLIRRLVKTETEVLE